MKKKINGLAWRLLLSFGILATTLTIADAEDQVQLVMTGSNRAIVIVNGERMVLQAGNSETAGVILEEADSQRAILKVNGTRHVLDTDSIAAPVLVDPNGDGPVAEPTEDKDDVVTLWADTDGFFYARGKVNRRTTRFLVDTGANTVTFSSHQAKQLGLRFQEGTDGYATTASGIAPMKVMTLDRVTVEGITLRNIEAVVVLGAFPEVPLLGGSFLDRLNMIRSGKKMELSRY